MKKTLFTALAFAMLVGVGIILPLSSAHAIESFAIETETRIYDQTQSYGGYFIPSNYDMGAGNATYLIDMEGYVVKKWDKIYGWAPTIQEDGTVWAGGYIHDWDGNVIWTYETASQYRPHHAWRKIWNKKLNKWTMLVALNRPITQAEVVAMGWDPSITLPDTRLGGMDFLAEITIDTNQIVWQWNHWDHGCQSKNPAWANYVSDVALAPGKFDVFWLTDNQRPAISGTAGPVRDWWHVNSIDYDDDTGHVVVNPKHWSDFFVIDHDKTFVSSTDWAANKAAAAGPAGDLLYRWGNPSSYNSGTAPGWRTEGDSQMYGSHDIQFIHPYFWKIPHLATDKWPDPRYYTKSGVALPGAGNFLIFDNGCYNPNGMKSRVLEINPRIGASGVEEAALGKYISQPAAGYKNTSSRYRPSRQLVWSFASQTQHSFYSSHISSAQRLPNGNTHVAAGNQGHFFEVTPAGRVVWEYLYPGIPGSTAFNLINTNNMGATTNAQCYRSYRYGKDFPGLAGKDLTPQGTLTGRLPRLVGSTYTYPTAVTYTGFGFGAIGVTAGGGGAGGAGGAGAGGY